VNSWIIKKEKILILLGLRIKALSKLPLTSSEKLADNPLLGGIMPVNFVNSAGIG
jgi:hypothetical protein